jgi:hypothetical protein
MAEKSNQLASFFASNKILIVVAAIAIIAVGITGFMYAQSESKFGSLYSNYTTLQTEKLNLQNSFAPLQANYSSLSANYSSLSANYSLVSAERDNLLKIVNLEKSVALEQGLLFDVYSDSYYEWHYVVDYAGYLVISFSSSAAPVFFTLNNGDNGYQVRYPADSSSGGTFIVPVLPGSNRLYINNPDLFAVTSVLLDITYVY